MLFVKFLQQSIQIEWPTQTGLQFPNPNFYIGTQLCQSVDLPE